MRLWLVIAKDFLRVGEVEVAMIDWEGRGGGFLSSYLFKVKLSLAGKKEMLDVLRLCFGDVKSSSWSWRL